MKNVCRWLLTYCEVAELPPFMMITAEWQVKDNYNIKLASLVPPNGNKKYAVHLLKLFESEPKYRVFASVPWNTSGGPPATGEEEGQGEGDGGDTEEGKTLAGEQEGATSASSGAASSGAVAVPRAPLVPLPKIDTAAAMRQLALLKARK